MSSARPLIDHDEIRKWAKQRRARPACVKGTGGARGQSSNFNKLVSLKSSRRRRPPRRALACGIRHKEAASDASAGSIECQTVDGRRRSRDRCRAKRLSQRQPPLPQQAQGVSA
jgi:hypothetical protein